MCCFLSLVVAQPIRGVVVLILPPQRPVPGTTSWIILLRERQSDGSWGPWRRVQTVPFGNRTVRITDLRADGVYQIRLNDNTGGFNQVLLVSGGIITQGEVCRNQALYLRSSLKY